MTNPTYIQKAALPSLLTTSNHHFLAAQTGTGKTMAYLLPILNRFPTSGNQGESTNSIGLIVTCTRELVIQMEYVLTPFQQSLGFLTASAYSGQKTEDWKEMWEKKPKIVCGTMDRLLALKTKGEIDIGKVGNLVIDECDTLVDSGKVQEIAKLVSEAIKVPDLRITLVSATFPRGLEAILDSYFTAHPATATQKPFLHRIIEEKTHFNLEHLRHEFVLMEDGKTDPIMTRLLIDVMKEMKGRGCIVFCNSIPSAEHTFTLMQKLGYSVARLHGDVASKDRIRNYRDFRTLETQFLVCTDLGSRGLDFPEVSHVIQSDFPKTTSDYLHRAGRAGRCFREGTVITLYRKIDDAVVKRLQESFEQGVPLRISSSAFS